VSSIAGPGCTTYRGLVRAGCDGPTGLEEPEALGVAGTVAAAPVPLSPRLPTVPATTSTTRIATEASRTGGLRRDRAGLITTL
jgi:hypothetical protein